MRKYLAVLLVGVMLLGSFSYQFAEKEEGPYTSSYGLAPINDERTIEMLKESGQISQNASYEEAMAYLGQLIAKKEKAMNQEAGQFAVEAQRTSRAKFENAQNSSNLFKGNGNKLGQTTKKLPSVVEEAYDGTVRTDQVLAILIDFPDFKANDITMDDTDMYYGDYIKSHYADMLFSTTGYVGPNGENLISMKQYYEAQSGGSYTVEGVVTGWYTASQPAAYYGGNDANDNDSNARQLVKEALLAAANDPNVDLSLFDQEDRYDLDGDGDYREPDGLVDHLMVFHASVGEEAGGGQLGPDAIWSHRWNLGAVFGLPNTVAQVPYWGGGMAAYDYTIQPADAAAGVCAHEYGHDLGLPDEYDTNYTGLGEPVSYWSLMSSGSWVGAIPGTEPSGFSPWAKQFFQANMGGNWLTGINITLDDLNNGNMSLLLDEASTKGTNNDVIRVSLPDKETIVTVPASGENMYYSQKGNDVFNYMYTSVDLTTASDAKLAFKAYYEIEEDWDYGFAFVYTADGFLGLPGNITSGTDPYGNIEAFGMVPGSVGFTGYSNGWIDAEFDLSDFVGQEVLVGIMYVTDSYVAESGLYVDDLVVSVDGQAVLSDDVEGQPAFALDGFVVDQGISRTEHYYLLEWRNHTGVDKGLGYIKRGDGTMSFEEGLLIWYADDFYDNNHVGLHPGYGFIGVVDADQDVNYWSDGNVGSTRYQLHDATFSLLKNDKMSFSYPDFSMKDYKRKFNTLFDDSKSYVNPEQPDAGRAVPHYGLKIKVIGESPDRTVGNVLIGF